MRLEITQTSKLEGTITISGSKNTALALIPCCILTDQSIVLENVPDISDVDVMLTILEKIGVNVVYNKKDKKLLLQKRRLKVDLDIEEVSKIRASYYIMGTLVARRYNFKTLYPGGCSFTKRPIDYHLDSFRSVGYKIKEKNNYIYFRSRFKQEKEIIFTMLKKSVGTTINLLYISVLRNAKTKIINASLEPEVLEVIKLLSKMGADIRVLNNNEIEINGVKKLNGACFKIVSDRIETGSYMLLACAVDTSDIILENVYLPHLKEIISTVRELGVEVIESKNQLEIIKTKHIVGIEKNISYYPMFPTDLQQILCAVLTKATTDSIIKDLVYPLRISHLKEIEKCSGSVTFKNNYIYIKPSKLYGNILHSHDLRCGFACIVLGAVSSKKTIVENIEMTLRGYENLVQKLEKIGLKIKEYY